MDQCKFLKILNPQEISQITIYIEFKRTDGLVHINARGEYGTEIFFKLNAIYQFK